MAAFYNEIDPYAAQWLRNLIAVGHIAPGVVDERSIEDIDPNELRHYTQCHFFAGIGVWSYALRLAGWPDDRPVWTGSCPCQPFSAAGKGVGFADERHLWPAFHYLISECRPPVVFGEQVASKDGLEWLDLVQADLEGSGYAAGAADLCAAGVGAPHIRQRLYWVADANDRSEGLVGSGGTSAAVRETHDAQFGLGRGSEDGGLADALHARRPEGWPIARDRSASGNGGDSELAHAHDTGLEGRRQPERQRAGERAAGPYGVVGGLADADSERFDGQHTRLCRQDIWRGKQDCLEIARDGEISGRPRPTNGHWRDADWLLCRDGKWRPVEPGTFPLAHGAAARVGRLRAYGNAIVPQVAQAFIEAYLDC